MQDHAPRCSQLSGCSSCWGCFNCRSLNPCDCRELAEAPRATVNASLAACGCMADSDTGAPIRTFCDLHGTGAAPRGCPSCIAGAVGDVCAWHLAKAAQGAVVGPPRVIEKRPTMRPTPQPRNVDGSYASRRFAAQLASMNEKIRRARESKPGGAA